MENKGTSQVATYAVMGNPIAQSMSPAIHQLFAEQTARRLVYEKRLVTEDAFDQAVRQFFSQGGCGLNITAPFKQRAFQLADRPTPRCLLAKAANTLWMHDGLLYADNTDGVGLLQDLARWCIVRQRRLLLLGAGGAARGVLAALLAAQPQQLILTNRTLEKAYELQRIYPEIEVCALSDLSTPCDLMINATSASLAAAPLNIPESAITSHTVCYDLAYNLRADTAMVAWAKAHQLVGVDGFGMLVAQAAESFFIWHGVRPNIESVCQHFGR